MAIRPRYLQIIMFCFTLCLLFFIAPLNIQAQKEDPQVTKIRAKALIDQLKLTEALPIYEKLVLALPDDPEVHFNFGFTLLGQATNAADESAAKLLRIRARNEFIRAMDLGDKSLLVKGFIEGIPLDGSAGKGFSDNAEANKYMLAGEAAFASGKLDDAFAAYQNALKADPRCYHAALFLGDVAVQKGSYSDAAIWYKRAIAIDPNIETAYRYSATPLMKQSKYDEARDLYVEAFVIDPYNKLAVNGLIQWGQATGSKLGHPSIDIPKLTVGADGKINSTLSMSSDPSDGSLAWMSYVTTRESWQKGKFAKQFPGQTYRHSLAEELEALQSVVSMAVSLKPKKLNEQIAVLAKMDTEGVLEAYILLAIPDQGIARDHRAFMLAHRDKLKKYVRSYVIAK